MSTPTLRLTGLQSGYPGQSVLHGVDLTVPAGHITVIGGHNAAGKTTLINTIAGHLPATRGTITLHGRDITAWPAHRRARAGIGSGGPPARCRLCWSFSDGLPPNRT
jgi:branched-chain amino acid transport system ATP-binding protein